MYSWKERSRDCFISSRCFCNKKKVYKPRAKKGIIYIIYNNNNYSFNISAYDLAVLLVYRANEDPVSKGSLDVTTP